MNNKDIAQQIDNKYYTCNTAARLMYNIKYLHFKFIYSLTQNHVFFVQLWCNQ
jgi:hypothetical protein